MKSDLIPVVGKTYYCYDDGKITPSREYTVKVTRIIPWEECGDKIRRLYNEFEDDGYMFGGIVPEYIVEAESNECPDSAPAAYFAYSKWGYWFGLGFYYFDEEYGDSISTWFNCGRLDLNGELKKWCDENFKQ